MGGLDINWFRTEKGHDPNVIRKSLERRFRSPTLVDDIIEKDKEWRKSTLEFKHSTIRFGFTQKRVERYWQDHQRQEESRQNRSL